MVGDDIVLEVMEIAGSSVRIGIGAPRSIPVFREEIYAALRDDKREAEDPGPTEPTEHGS